MTSPVSQRFTLALLSLSGIGRKTACAVLLAEKTSPESADGLLEVVMHKAGRRGRNLTIHDTGTALERADEIIAESNERNIAILCINDDSYPAQLRAIDDPPAVVFVRGNQTALTQSDSVAIIGTRQPTNFGKKSAHRIASRLANESIVIVSGLALGCDTEAHEGCIESGGRTIAVLAHGLDTVYPKTNLSLAERILEHEGALVSEYPVKEQPRPNYFVERDRIQSALSKLVLVIETGVDGGTMHTVRFAQKQGRQVACLVHPSEFSNEPETEGNKKLIREGIATPVENTDDLQYLVTRVRAPRREEAERGEKHQQIDVQSELWGSGDKSRDI